MKKIIFLFCLISMNYGIFAQTSAYVYEMGAGGSYTIVRSWDGVGAVSYYRSGLDGYLDLSEPSLHRVQMPDNIWIYDMFIDGDILFFCGLFSGGYGVVGHLDLNDFFNTTMPISYLKIPQVTSLNKLVEFSDTVVAIGEKIISVAPYTYSLYYIFNCSNIMSPVSTYEIAPLSTKERCYDVILTQRFVAFMGYEEGYDALSIRRSLRRNTWSGLLDTLYYYPTGATEAFSALHSTTMNNNIIATTYLHIKNTRAYTRIRPFNISTMVNTRSQQFSLDDRHEPQDITYIPRDMSLVVLTDFTNLLGYNFNFVHLIPSATTNYTTQFEYIPGYAFESLTTMGIGFYLAGKGPLWYIRNKTATLPTTGACANSENIDIQVIDNISTSFIYNPLIRDVYLELEQTVVCDVSVPSISIGCINL